MKGCRVGVPKEYFGEGLDEERFARLSRTCSTGCGLTGC